MATEGLTPVNIKLEQDAPVVLKSPPLLPYTCQAPRQNCTQPRTLNRGGSLHDLCTLHRRQAQRTEQQRKRLLRILVDALKPRNEDTTAAESTDPPRRRPRLVLLGNQQTLILGVVLSELSEHVDVSSISRSML